MSSTGDRRARRRWWRPVGRGASSAVVAARARVAAPELVTTDLVAVAPHQDDEVLTLGPAILAAVAAGRSVTVLLVSRGEGSSVRTRQLPKQLGFVPSLHHFSAMRDREFDGAVRAMGATPLVLPYELRLPDGGATTEAVVDLVGTHVPAGTEAVTVSWHDDHPDHQACGRAVQQLVRDGHLSRAGYLISPERLELVPDGVVLEKVGTGSPVTREHQESYRRRDIPGNWWAIGVRSVKESFDYQLLHDPYGYRHD
ncbi:PIG-L deacetylase family protein [Ornithinimicrobium pekingense]|uniref:PIG-L deacetylase family protein n=1 Tax=Ornithinimicrobium pekingense TaxID=384677 RepID=UPI00146E6D28|nr:PIG-L family deacetylase [Ornithinimicrobium pekingense]